VVLYGCEEIHDDLDLLLDENLGHVVVHAYDCVVVELEHLDWLVRAAVEVLEPEDLLGLVWHVAYLVLGHVTAEH